MGLNDTYILETDQVPYIFRIYGAETTSLTEILFELAFIKHLKDSGLSVSCPVQTRDGRDMITIQYPEGNRYAVIFTYAEGTRIDLRKNADLFGQSVADLHLLANNFQYPDCLTSRILWKELFFIYPVVSGWITQSELEWLHELNSVVNKTIEKYDSLTDKCGFCHGDLHGYNSHISTKGIITHFDFEFSGYFWRMYDLSVLHWELQFNCHYSNKKKDEIWNAFLESYSKLHPISNIDYDIIPYFTLLRQIWYITYTAKQNGVRKSYNHEIIPFMFARLKEYSFQHLT